MGQFGTEQRAKLYEERAGLSSLASVQRGCLTRVTHRPQLLDGGPRADATEPLPPRCFSAGHLRCVSPGQGSEQDSLRSRERKAPHEPQSRQPFWHVSRSRRMGSVLKGRRRGSPARRWFRIPRIIPALLTCPGRAGSPSSPGVMEEAGVAVVASCQRRSNSRAADTK